MESGGRALETSTRQRVELCTVQVCVCMHAVVLECEWRVEDEH